MTPSQKNFSLLSKDLKSIVFIYRDPLLSQDNLAHRHRNVKDRLGQMKKTTVEFNPFFSQGGFAAFYRLD